jgi:ABC-type polysaccharide/polyol phosphate export permease
VSVTIALLYFPLDITLPVLLGMGWVDPLVGELRHRKSDLNPMLPMVVYFFILLIGLGYFYGMTFPVLLSAVLGAPVALFLESRRFPYIDDDMILILVPAFLVALVLGELPF